MSFITTPERLSLAPAGGDDNLGVDQKRLYSARFPVYQIDFVASKSGKHISMTKRRICWRFGFSNSQALEKGLTSTDCRGEEHDVTLVWSVTSGKRLILADGQQVYFSAGRSGSKFEFSWKMRAGHTAKIIAYAASPLGRTSDFRQFDFLLDGQSFFDMPKIFELGLTQVGEGWMPNVSTVRKQGTNESIHRHLMLTSDSNKENKKTLISDDWNHKTSRHIQRHDHNKRRINSFPESESRRNNHHAKLGGVMKLPDSLPKFDRTISRNDTTTESPNSRIIIPAPIGMLCPVQRVQPIDVFDQHNHRLPLKTLDVQR